MVLRTEGEDRGVSKHGGCEEGHHNVCASVSVEGSVHAL